MSGFYSPELFEIRKLSSVFVQVKTQIGLQMLYDREGLRLYLQVDERWKDDTVGLCGTFNGNTEDDFLYAELQGFYLPPSPVGVTESTPELFGNTWKTSSACVAVQDSSQLDPCDVHLQAASYAAEACSILTKDLFAPCYPYLSPVPYFEQCRRDTCKCGQPCFCSALAHYAHHCRRFGVVIDFRGSVSDCAQCQDGNFSGIYCDREGKNGDVHHRAAGRCLSLSQRNLRDLFGLAALSCEDTKEYSTCVSTCGRTCQALSVPEPCSSDCVEGCACPSGMFLDARTERCVQRNECPCYFQGIDYTPGEHVMTSLGKCHCRDGVMNCDNNIIAHSCPAGQVYINCSQAGVDPELSRERTCENQLLNLTWPAHLPCVSGCVCPPGLVKHGDMCLDADECPCSWKGKEYFPGDKVISSCHTCVCQHGSFQCRLQPCPAMCSAYGDRHYRTFDGLTFDFAGACRVHLVKGTSPTSLSIITENIDCFSTGIICRKNIFINVGKSFLIFDDETGNPSLNSYIDGLQKVQLWRAGFFTVVHFPAEHITILWDQRTTVHVQMGHQWQGEVTGLCGNFDLKTVNELRTPDNFELTNSQEFGNSWTAVECADSSDTRNPCSLNPLRESFAKKECGILLGEAFEACHPVIDVTWFYSNCMADTCGCTQGGDCECFCTSVSAYAHQCCQQGVAVDWRSPRLCPYDCEYFNKALGKGPYKLVSYLDGKLVMAAKLVDSAVFPVKEEDIAPGHVVSFMLTSGLYKPKAHDSNLISFETAERPNYFLQLASNNTLVVSKWKKLEDFHNRSTFVIHKNTWLSGYSSFESFAKPGYFIHISASSVELLKYHHSEEFRLSTLFKLVDVKFKLLSRSTCEWRYDACTSPCFRTCRDPLGKTCQTVPKVEGCIPACPLNMLLDEITQRCVYFEDCIEPADDSPPLLPSTQSSAVPHPTPSAGLAVLREEGTSFPVPAAKETALATKLQLPATPGKPEFSAITSNKTLPAVTLSPNISSQSTEMTSGSSTAAMTGTTKSDVSLSAPVAISPLFPSTFSSGTSPGVELTSSGSTDLLRAAETQTAAATRAVTTRTEPESKPVATSFFTGAPPRLSTAEMPVQTKIMELSEMTTRTLPTKEAQVKQEGLTTFAPSSFGSVTEKTTAYVPQFSTSPLEVSSFTPPVTGAPEGTKISVEQAFTPVANVTGTSFSPILTTSSLLKPVSSAATEAAAVLPKQRLKTTLPPTSTAPTSTGKTATEPPPGMAQQLTAAPELLLTSSLGPKMTTLQTQETSSETTLLSFTTHKKETPKTTSHVEHTSSSHSPPYSPHPSSTTEKSFILSTKRPAVSAPTPASPASGELKKTFKTVSTTGYPLHMVLNTTEVLTTLYTKYPGMAETTSVTPSSVKVTSKITSPLEMATKSTLFSGKASTEYKSALVSSTEKTSTAAYSGSVSTSAMKTKETTPAPFVVTERESLQRTSSTGSPLALFSGTETTLLTTQPAQSQIEAITAISTGKPSALSFSPSGALTSLNISLPSLPSDGKEALLTTLSPMHTSHEITSLYPRTTIQRSMLTTEKTSAVPTLSILSILEQSGSITAVPDEKSLVNITDATFSPTSEFSSQLITTKKMTGKEKSSLSPSVAPPVTKSSHTFSTSQYLGEKFSSPSLTQLLPEVTTAPKYSAETKMVSAALKPAVQSVTEAVKLPEAAAQPSLPPSSAGPFSLQTSSGAELSVETTRTSVTPPPSAQKSTERGHQSSGPPVTSLVLQYPAGSVPTAPGQPQPALSTAGAAAGPASSRTSLPAASHSAGPPASAAPTRVISPTQKYLHLTDSVTQTLGSRTSVLQPTAPATTTADLIFGTKSPPLSPEVLAASSPLTTIKKESFPSFPTQKAATDLEFTHQASFTKSFDSKQTLEASPESKSTSSMVFLTGTTEIPVGLGPTPRESGAEGAVVLPEQVTAPGSTSSPLSPPRTALSPGAHSAPASPATGSAGQNLSTAAAASGKAAASTEPISSSPPVPSEAKGAVPLGTARAEGSQSPAGLQPVLTQAAAVTPQTFYPLYFTDTSSLLSTVHSPAESKPSSSAAPSSVSTTQTSQFGITSELQTPVSSVADHPNDTAAPSVSSFTSLSTKPLHGLATAFSDGLAIAEAMAGAAASPFMLPQETATLQTCTPISESECIKHICVDGQLIQVNQSQHCPYNATQPSCGVLGLPAQTNGDKCCPRWECACRCTIFSDLSIVTYDGNHLALFKEASYIVSQTPDETITIHVLDCRMSDSNSTSLCLAMLNLTYVSNQIIINRLSRKITVNSRSAWPTVRKYGYKVEDSGFKYAIETPTKIRIQWFHDTGVMIIDLNSTREPGALGLCGFCDRSLENDLMLPNRTVLSPSSSPSIFIDSWQVPDTLKYVGEDRHQETNCSVMDCSECLRMVLNQTFSSCHPYIPPEQFCDIWARDTEYIRNPCVSLAAYVAMCNKFNVCIEWRSSDFCPFPCSESFSYQPCIAACEVPESCQSDRAAGLGSESCSELTEGCVCAGGTVLHRTHTALCVPQEKCGTCAWDFLLYYLVRYFIIHRLSSGLVLSCTDSSGTPRAVGEVWSSSSRGCCLHTCAGSGTIVPVEHSCPQSHALQCQRFAEVALLVPSEQSCCPHEICICNQSLCELLIPECSSLEKLVTYYSEESCCPSYVCECDPEKCEPLEQMPSCQEDQTLIAARVESTCCISYICACGACSDQIPKCQEGEVLIVDGNTTDKCCPTYQCMCETHRCPEFRCMLGMSLVEVWSPERCCPFRTCECACETIPKPQCKLGQKLQIDELFQNSTENVCNCVKYKCVRDKVCLSSEQGVLLPGQSIVEHSADGTCHISHCTNTLDPSTKLYQINSSSIDCTAKCTANQIYQPPKDLTTCCGSCKNLSCLHTFSNGTVTSFKPGAVWISNCIRYECTNTAIGAVLVSSAVGCPPFNETECVKVGGYVVPFLEGCCKTCKEDGKFCKKVTVRMTIRKNDCRSNTPVNIVSCDGKCPSASIYNYNINAYARFCKCCRELGLHRRTVQLYCTSNSTWVSYSIQEPTDCSCQWS
ncbi:hypothetical protein Nmel_006412 [Mimus melanotis]